MSTPEVYDLHCHSKASDGVLSATDLVQRAHSQGVTTLALTDHDTVAGLAEAHICADSIGITLINGMELSANWKSHCFHIVGLGIDSTYAPLLASLENMQTTRDQRAAKIADKLAKKRIPGALEYVQNKAGDGMITRTHFADFLVSQHHVDTQQEAFDRYLGKGKSAFVATEWPELAQAVSWITAAGGVAVLAHPLRYKLTAAWMKRVLATFKEAGGQAIEVVVSRMNADDIKLATSYAMQFELAGSMGSDFHTPANQWVELGRLAPFPDKIKPVWELLG
ncbi:Protein TrpH [Crenothrix polyspora]|uniref:Protein TrpH n=1 Tax=Crenothrix polyspora TaxID=360316 RepID=A0A1R4GZZ0_9GAMM|nr:PHP domain-containing protein [Crenothrix polyspora]SJM89573.1 Protein TrpH [Crenothrix polyspora]